MIRFTRGVALAVIVLAWVVAAGGLVSGFFDVSGFPEPLRNVLGLWPEPGTALGTVLRVGAVAVLIGAIVAYRALGRADVRREQAELHAGRGTHAG